VTETGRIAGSGGPALLLAASSRRRARDIGAGLTLQYRFSE